MGQMMARLIDANDVLKHFEGYGWGTECDAEIVLGYIAQDAQPVDAVEVVRCRDCKQWEAREINGKKILGKCLKLRAPMRYNCFCCYGERKLNEG